MDISVFTGGPAQTNGYFLKTSDGGILIDAPEGIAEWLKSRNHVVHDVLLTHQHYDHVGDAAALSAAGASLHAFAPYSSELTLVDALQAWGMPIHLDPYKIDHLIVPSDSPQVIGGIEFICAHIPGHSSDSITFHLPAAELAFSGDTVFAGSVGRTDLPGGDHRTLVSGIRKHLLKLPGPTRLLPGHGAETTVAREMSANPYL